MSELPPPIPGSLPPPQPAYDPNTRTPAVAFYHRHKVLMWTLFAIAGIGVYALTSVLKSDTTKSATSASDKRLETLTAAWNRLPADQRFEICASVHKNGLDAAADEVQRAAGQFSTAVHDDVTFFLDFACN